MSGGVGGGGREADPYPDFSPAWNLLPCRWYALCIRARMLTAFVLICSASLTPNLADCSPENARAAIRVPTEFANPVTCLMQSQAFLAETSVGQELDDDDRVKIVWSRRAPVSAMK
jgi:hypothetical protein